MDIMRAMELRHSVRAYTDRPIEEEVLSALRAEIDACNRESGLHIQLVTGEPRAFNSLMARYGSFSGVTDYLVLAGKKGPELEERCGFYGERLVLLAQSLGLNSCWVAMTYRKVRTAYVLEEGEKAAVVIALGYGQTQGVPHKSKPIEAVVRAESPLPDWFRRGVEAALLAPTALNQQKFTFSLDGDRVSARAGSGFYTKIDLGIAKYHFEAGAGRENFRWKEN